MRVLNRIFYSFVPSTRIKKHFMFQLYLLLRLKNFGRIVIELGIFRIVFLTILTVAAIMILFLAENRFVIPVVCVLLLASYHNYRKDKEFLHTLTSHLPVFLIKEYTLITLPFAGMEMIKGRFTEAIGLWLFATLLPFLKEIKLEHKPIRLPFSTKEVMNIYGCSANLSGYMPYSCFFP